MIYLQQLCVSTEAKTTRWLENVRVMAAALWCADPVIDAGCLTIAL